MLKLRLFNSKKLYPLDRVNFHNNGQNERFFTLESSEDNNISLSISVPLQIKTKFSPSKFDCIPFNSPTFFKEQDIFQIFVNDPSVGRIGWIFPVQSLASDKHSLAENEHFLNYAYIAYSKLLHGLLLPEEQVIETASFEEDLSITDIFQSTMVIMALSDEKTQLIPNFNIDDFLPALYIQDYFYYTGAQILANGTRDVDDYPTVRINITPISEFLKGEIFISSLFKTLLTKNNHPLVQFHLLYQIVELLINKVYDCEIRKLLTSTIDRAKSPHEILEETNQIAPEGKRISRLIDEYIPEKKYPPNSLIDASNDLLRLFNTQKTSIGDAFYQVRNTIVHNYRTVSKVDPNSKLLSNINIEFLRFLVDVLENYVEPENNFEFYDMPTAWLLYMLQKEIAKPG